ncbi:GNAT family N-acetyltransferase [Streptomyces sp. 35G-GA-8]|uniref:GNAT family N-acetyltransferase n=1 Tax=Streptomyces sp. 35G-GA-8 TaxID=2939434 RepID=UPI00201E9AF9|nr:GNAT family N-acetyltransferase [Streptomyces sp. 35G-GA-8]MCL7381277.1 GNAT family N-acetyltransferase [Streptomyces sp. 35G-GA-8]
MNPHGTVTLRHYGPNELDDGVRTTLAEVYAEVYADRLSDPFFSVERFQERLDGHVSRPGWEVVVGYDGGEAIGYAYGSALPEGSRWWAGMLSPLPKEDIDETGGRRTLALFELMVRQPWRKTGNAHHIHEALLANRPEERVTLLVEPSHPKVQALYEQWGYKYIGDQQPFPDAPVYATMLRPLP